MPKPIATTKVVESDLNGVKAALDPKLAKKAKRNSINQGGTVMKKLIKDKVRERYTIKIKRYNEAVRKPIRATRSKSDYILNFFGGVPGLFGNFKIRAFKRGGVKVEVTRGNSVKLNKAFVGKDSFGANRSVYERVYDARKRLTNAGRYANTNIRRQPLRRLTGPSVPAMVNKTYTRREQTAVAEQVARLFVRAYDKLLEAVK